MASVSWSPHLGSFHICRHVCGCSCDTSCDSFSTSQLSHKPAFTQTRFSTHHLLHQPALEISPVNQTSFYPHQLLRKPTFRPTSFYTNIRTPSQTTFCTNQLLQTSFYTQLLRPALVLCPKLFWDVGNLIFGDLYSTLWPSTMLRWLPSGKLT